MKSASELNLYHALKIGLPSFVYRMCFDIYERDRWERAVCRAWFRIYQGDQ